MPDEPIPVLVLGTSHLSGWNGKDGRPDLLSSAKQAELDEVIASLKEYRPTKVGVETLAAHQPKLETLWSNYLSDPMSSKDRNEIFQIGFRLARETGASVHAVDADWALLDEELAAYLKAHPEARLADDLSPAAHALIEDSRRAEVELTLRDYLRYTNEAPRVYLNDREYLDRWLSIGAGDTWIGVDFVASWYRRNLRILANLHQIAEPGDRIFVLIGSAHAPSLRHFLEVSGRFEDVSPMDFL